MIWGISAFEAIVYASIVLFALLISTILLTVGYSWYTFRSGTRETDARESLKDDLLEELGSPSPDWERWAADLTPVERRAIRDILREYLEIVSGTEREELRALGYELAIDSWAAELLHEGDREEQLQALHWMERLGSQEDILELTEQCQGDRELEAKAVNVLLAGDHPFMVDIGTELLLSRGVPLSLRGMDALLRLYENQAGLLFDYAEQHVDAWDDLLLHQVLRVLHKCSAADIERSIPWLLDLVGHHSDLVRSGAIRIISEYPWHPEFREGIQIEQLVNDPSERVRMAAFNLLGTWGDDPALDLLVSAVDTEPNERARIEGTRMLYRHREQLHESLPQQIEDTWGWVRARQSVKS